MPIFDFFYSNIKLRNRIPPRSDKSPMYIFTAHFTKRVKKGPSSPVAMHTDSPSSLNPSLQLQ